MGGCAWPAGASAQTPSLTWGFREGSSVRHEGFSPPNPALSTPSSSPTSRVRNERPRGEGAGPRVPRRTRDGTSGGRWRPWTQLGHRHCQTEGQEVGWHPGGLGTTRQRALGPGRQVVSFGVGGETGGRLGFGVRIPRLRPGLRGPLSGTGLGVTASMLSVSGLALGSPGPGGWKGTEKAHTAPTAAGPPQSPKLNISASFSFQKAKLRSM